MVGSGNTPMLFIRSEKRKQFLGGQSQLIE